MRAAQAGDLCAFEALYRQHVGRVHGLCLRMTGNRDAAEELAQDAFVRAWRKLPGFRGESAFATWLTRLTVNVVVSSQRGQRRQARWAVSAALVAPAGRQTATATRIDLDRAIAGLPPQARHVFVLHAVAGYGHAEIGRALGIAVGTSKAQLHRARKLLQEVLQP